MSIQRIDCYAKRTHGFQARAYVGHGQRLTKFFSDREYGGLKNAAFMAEREELRLKRQAQRIRKQQTIGSNCK